MDERGLIDPESSPVKIRTLRKGDLQRLVAIDVGITGRTRRLWFEAKLERALEEADVCISVGAEHEGLLVGALMGVVRFGEFGVMEPVAVLDTVLVDPDFKGQGVARAMLDQLVQNLRALRVTSLRTEVSWSDQDLIGFFNRSGFVPVPRLVLELAVDGEGERRGS